MRELYLWQYMAFCHPKPNSNLAKARDFYIQFWGCIFSLILFLIPPIVSAENVVVHGISFPVDEITSVDGTNVRLVVGESSLIIPRKDLDDRVVKLYLGQPQLSSRLARTSLIKFASESVKGQDIDWAAAALVVILSRSSDALDARREVEQILSSDQGKANPASIDVARKVLGDLRLDKSVVKGGGYEVLLLIAGLNNPEWIRENALRLALDRRAEVRIYFKDQVHRALRARDFERAKLILNLYSVIYGGSDRDFEDLRVLSSRVDNALRSAEVGDVDPLYTLFQITKSEPELGEILSPILIEALHREANRAFTSGNPGRVLEILARIDFAKRTPTTHDLVIRALDALPPGKAALLNDPVVKEFLIALGQQDQRVGASYLNLIGREIEQQLGAGDLDSVSSAIDRALVFRPDPSSENDQFRFRQALAYFERDMAFSARNRISEIQTGLTLWQQAKLYVAGYYGNPWIYVALGLIPTFFLFYLIAKDQRLRRERRQFRRSQAAKEEDPSEPYFSDDDAPKSFVSSRARVLSPLMKEYRGLLLILGLKSGVDARTIKTTYRQLIKTVHPDLNNNLSEADKERFVSLTRSYERILELRKEMGMPE